MSGARLMQILASLARRSPLRTLHTICETQHQISTRKLEQYLEPIGDELAGFAFNLRQDYDQLHAANQRLESNYDEACEDAMEVARKCRRLEGEVKRLAASLSGHLAHWKPKSRKEMDAKNAAAELVIATLSTANGEVTE